MHSNGAEKGANDEKDRGSLRYEGEIVAELDDVHDGLWRNSDS
ncbi:hypothetical protein [Sulfitobacter dubius]